MFQRASWERRAPRLQLRLTRMFSWLGLSLYLLLSLNFGAPLGSSQAFAADNSPEIIVNSSELTASEGSAAQPSHSPQIKRDIPTPPSDFLWKAGDGYRFAFPAGTEVVSQKLIEIYEGARAEYSAKFGIAVPSEATIFVVRDAQQMDAIGGEIGRVPAYADAVAFPKMNWIILPLMSRHPNQEYDAGIVLRHEVAHLALEQATLGHDVPLWFNEGLAVHFSGEAGMARIETLTMASLSGRLIPLKDLSRGFPERADETSVAYAESADLVRFLVRGQERHRFHALIKKLRSGASFDQALQASYDLSLSDLEFDWRREVSARYSFWPVLLGGGGLWVIIFGLSIWGWRRRKKRAERILNVWRQEEELKIRSEEIAAAAERARLVLLSIAEAARTGVSNSPSIEPSELPAVEEDGQWHTLH